MEHSSHVILSSIKQNGWLEGISMSYCCMRKARYIKVYKIWSHPYKTNAFAATCLYVYRCLYIIISAWWGVLKDRYPR